MIWILAGLAAFAIGGGIYIAIIDGAMDRRARRTAARRAALHGARETWR